MLRFLEAHRAARAGLSLAVLAVLAAAACGPVTDTAREPADDPAGGAEPAGASALALDDATPWTDTGSMTQARQLLAAAPLPDDRVLVIGGLRVGAIDTGNVYFDTAEIFDPSAPPEAAFTLVRSKMSQKRLRHAAAVLADGRVLVVGGEGDAQSAATSEIFDPASETFGGVATLQHRRTLATATLLPDGTVLAAGGDGLPGDSSPGSAEVFDPALGTWTLVAPMSTPRRAHTATPLPSGRVLVIGGRDLDNKPLATVELFQPPTGPWLPRPPMNVARHGHTATLLADGRVLVAGGATDPPDPGAGAAAEIYNPATNTWTQVMSMETARHLHTATLLDNGGVLVAGGIDATSSALRSAELFDPDAEQWVPVGLMSHGRLAHVAVLLADGSVLAAGGEHQSSAEIYRAAPNGAPCDLGRQCASGACVDGVCCNDACTGQCVTCILPGFEGDCSPAAPGTDPHNDCGQGGPCDDVCDANGACVDRIGDICNAPACLEGGLHAVLPTACVEVGGACPENIVDCTPYRCGTVAATGEPGCLDRCASVDDCADGYACDTDGTCRTPPDVAAADPETCAASPGAPVSPRPLAAWLAGLALAAAALRSRPRRRRTS